MLVSAYSYKNEIEHEMAKRFDDDEMFYYTGSIKMYIPEIKIPNGGTF